MCVNQRKTAFLQAILMKLNLFGHKFRQAIELTERTSTEQAASIREPLNAVNRRWENLLRGMVERQKQLEHALLHLGQFQHALNELLVWINKTDNTLDQLKPVSTHTNPFTFLPSHLMYKN